MEFKTSGVEIRDTKAQRFFRNWWLSFFFTSHTHTLPYLPTLPFMWRHLFFSDFQGGINTDGDGLLQRYLTLNLALDSLCMY